MGYRFRQGRKAKEANDRNPSQQFGDNEPDVASFGAEAADFGGPVGQSSEPPNCNPPTADRREKASSVPGGPASSRVSIPGKTAHQLVPMGGSRDLRAPAEVLDLAKEREGDQPTLAEAMMAQSTAITTLVSQLAASGGDPMTELTGSSLGMRGAQGRAKLQSELASHKGIFFDAVLKQMSRRMAPTMSIHATPEEMMSRGICGTKYLESSGYGRCRDLGVIQHQVMTAMDFLQMGNVGSGKGHGLVAGSDVGAGNFGWRPPGQWPTTRQQPSSPTSRWLRSPGQKLSVLSQTRDGSQ